MKKIKFPPPFKRKHPPIKNVNELLEEGKTFGQRAADWVSNLVGSWKFIIAQSAFLAGWATLNVTAWVRHWDPYPFILMNLALSLQAAYAAPIIMMSQNRQAQHDRLEAHNDYLVNLKTEERVQAILEHNSAQNEALFAIYQTLLKLEERMDVSLGKSSLPK